MACKKVFFFGIDGAPPRLIFDKWVDKLPTIKGLMEQGSFARLNSTVPPVSAVAWISMYTRKHPKDHGVF